MDWLWMWVAVFLMALTLEIVTEQLVAVWMLPAAAVAGVVDIFLDSIIVESIIFVLLTAIGIFVIRRYIKSDSAKEYDLSAVVGEKCTVTERIDTFAGCGQAKVKGQLWSARGLDPDDIFEEGDVLQIVGVEGVKLICRRI